MAKTVEKVTDLPSARRVEKRILDEAARHGYDDSSMFGIRLALEEGLNNAIKHGNRYDPTKAITVCYEVDAGRVAVTIADEGVGFDPCSVPDPTADENLEKPCGRGLMLIRAYMDEVRFNERGNQIHMVKLNT